MTNFLIILLLQKQTDFFIGIRYYFFNLHFYGAGIYNISGKLYNTSFIVYFYIGGKLEKGKKEDDFKHKIYSYEPDTCMFKDAHIAFSVCANFIESKLFYCQDGNIGHMTEYDENDALLVTIGISNFLN